MCCCDEIEVANFYYLLDPTHRQDGFKAQQLYKVIPYAVTKPETDVDAEGKILPWLADYSKVVPLVTAAVQELYRKFLGHDQQLATQAREIASVKTDFNAKLEAKDQEITELKAKVAKAEQENVAMKARLDNIEKLLNGK